MDQRNGSLVPTRGLNMKHWYSGVLDRRKMNRAEQKAYISFWSQTARCYKKDNKDYHAYGAKNIKIKYSVREFIGWYVYEFSKKTWEDPTVGRIDHSKNYSFDNIEMQERGDNTKEMIRRRGHNARCAQPCIKIVAYKDGNFFGSYPSTYEAGKGTGHHHMTVSRISRGLYKKTKDGFSYVR